jgi:hypothetical protein
MQKNENEEIIAKQLLNVSFNYFSVLKNTASGIVYRREQKNKRYSQRPFFRKERQGTIKKTSRFLLSLFLCAKKTVQPVERQNKKTLSPANL